MLVTVLNFHGIGTCSRQFDPGEQDCWLETSHFTAVLDLVKGRGDVQLTFDDGNVSDLQIAVPALLERDMQATFFVCSGRLNSRWFLSPENVREIKKCGMAVGSHGVEHCSWRAMRHSERTRALEESRRTLEEICGESVTEAACPFGDYDRHVLSGLRRAGYSRVFTSDGGKADTSGWVMARNTVRAGTTLDDLEAMLRPSSCWQRAADHLRCAVKRQRW